MTKERRYTAEQLSDAEMVKATNIFMAGMEAQRAIDEPAMA